VVLQKGEGDVVSFLQLFRSDSDVECIAVDGIADWKLLAIQFAAFGSSLAGA
jgi:hypothetical protein